PRRIAESVRQQMLGGEPFALRSVYLTTLEDPEIVERAAIPVERIDGPVLLISGQDDQLWPSSVFADMVVERLAKHRHPYPYRHLSYEGAGHGIGFPYAPTTVTASRHPVRGVLLRSGGDPKATAHAQVDSWRQVQQFLSCPGVR